MDLRCRREAKELGVGFLRLLLALQVAIECLQHAHDSFLDGGVFVEGAAPFGKLPAEKQGWRIGLFPHDALRTPFLTFQLQGKR
jgi:hypothetical protein